LRVITDKEPAGTTAQTDASGSEVHFVVEETCGNTQNEAASYTLQFHL
jgi:hypothetical protein